MLIDLTLRVTPELRQDAEKNEKMVFSGHLGTHFDVMDKEFPLEYSCRKGIVFDVSGAEGEIALSEKELDRIREEAFVLFYTGFIGKEGYGTETYTHHHPQLSRELITQLLEKRVSLIVIDFAGVRRGKEHGEADRRCADQGTFIIENLCNLKELLPLEDGFTVRTFPMNFAGLSGLPCRVIAETDQ